MVLEVYGVHLSAEEKARLKRVIRSGRNSAQAATWARILLKTDEGWTASRVAAAFGVSERTVRRAKRRYVEEGLEEVLRHHKLTHSPLQGGRQGVGPPDRPCLQSGAGGS